MAESTINALSHIDVIFSGAAGAIWSGLGLDCDGEGGASGLAELAGNASLLASWVTSEGMLTTEHWTQRTLLPRVMDDVLR